MTTVWRKWVVVFFKKKNVLFFFFLASTAGLTLTAGLMLAIGPVVTTMITTDPLLLFLGGTSILWLGGGNGLLGDAFVLTVKVYHGSDCGY